MSNIDGLASQWLEVKALEKQIIAQRHAIEEQITEALDAKDEGSEKITYKDKALFFTVDYDKSNPLTTQ